MFSSVICRNIITSFWYIAQALGTLLNAGIAQIPGLSLREEFFMYTGLMLVVTALFVVINWKYKYKTEQKKTAETVKSKEDATVEVSNTTVARTPS